MGGTILVGSVVLVAVILLWAVERQRTDRLARRVEALEGCAAGRHADTRRLDDEVTTLWGAVFPDEVPVEPASTTEDTSGKVERWDVPVYVTRGPVVPEVPEAPTYATLPERYGCGAEPGKPRADGWTAEHDGSAA